MKAVLLAVAGLLSIISAQAQQNLCGAPTYKEEISPPTCLSNPRIKMPYYRDESQYIDCASGKPIVKPCKVAGTVFCNVYQECTACSSYIPAVDCGDLGWNLPCQPIANVSVTTVTASTSTSTVTPSSTTPPTSTSTTTRPPVTTPTTTTQSSGGVTPGPGSGTTIYVEGPPEPNDPNVPTPPTPAPTAATIQPFPPTAP